MKNSQIRNDFTVSNIFSSINYMWMWNKFHSYCKCTNHCQNERKYYWGLEPRQLFQITNMNWQKSLKGERLLNFLSIWRKKYTNCMEAWFCAIVHRRHTIYGYAIISNTTKIDLFSTYGLGAKKSMNNFSWTNDIRIWKYTEEKIL